MERNDGMSVFRVEKNSNYTIMSNYHLRDQNLSLKAKGLLSYMLSLPEDWDYSLNGLCAICKESEGAIKSTLKELKDNGYLVIEKVRGEKGYFEYNYIIYEHPYNLEKTIEKPEGKNPPVDNPKVENDTQINTKKQSIKNKTNKINKINKTIDEKESKNDSLISLKKHHSMTKDLVKRKYLEEDDVELFKYDALFKELLEDYKFDDIVVICHYIVSSVVNRHFKNDEGYLIENKFGYLKQAILNNIDRFNNNELEWDEELGWFREPNIFEEEYEFDIDY